VKHAALKGSYNLLRRRETIDFDYLDKLNESELDFLNAFMEEENNANLTHKGQKFNVTPDERKRIWKKNNSRNFDIYSLKLAESRLVNDDYEALVENSQSVHLNEEDVWIKNLDLEAILIKFAEVDVDLIDLIGNELELYVLLNLYGVTGFDWFFEKNVMLNNVTPIDYITKKIDTKPKVVSELYRNVTSMM
jgi:hypothetical protein